MILARLHLEEANTATLATGLRLRSLECLRRPRQAEKHPPSVNELAGAAWIAGAAKNRPWIPRPISQ